MVGIILVGILGTALVYYIMAKLCIIRNKNYTLLPTSYPGYSSTSVSIPENESSRLGPASVFDTNVPFEVRVDQAPVPNSNNLIEPENNEMPGDNVPNNPSKECKICSEEVSLKLEVVVFFNDLPIFQFDKPTTGAIRLCGHSYSKKVM